MRPGAAPPVAETEPVAAPSTPPARAASIDRLGMARTWGARALWAYGAALILLAVAVLVRAALAAAALGDAGSLGSAALSLILLILAGLALAVLGQRTVQLGRALAKPATVPPPTKAALRAAQAFAAVALAIGLLALVAGFLLVGLLALGTAAFALLAASGWTSPLAGSQARSALLAAVAGFLWLLATVDGRAAATLSLGWPFGSAAAVLLPPGAAVLAAGLAALAFAALQRTANRAIAPAGAALAALLGSAQLVVAALDVLGRNWPRFAGLGPLEGTAYIFAALALALGLVAGLVGAVASVVALSHYGPTVVARAGAGFLAPTPGAPCPRCGLVPAVEARYCPDCGAAMRPAQPPSQGI